MIPASIFKEIIGTMHKITVVRRSQSDTLIFGFVKQNRNEGR